MLTKGIDLSSFVLQMQHRQQILESRVRWLSFGVFPHKDYVYIFDGFVTMCGTIRRFTKVFLRTLRNIAMAAKPMVSATPKLSPMSSRKLVNAIKSTVVTEERTKELRSFAMAAMSAFKRSGSN